MWLALAGAGVLWTWMAVPVHVNAEAACDLQIMCTALHRKAQRQSRVRWPCRAHVGTDGGTEGRPRAQVGRGTPRGLRAALAQRSDRSRRVRAHDVHTPPGASVGFDRVRRQLLRQHIRPLRRCDDDVQQSTCYVHTTCDVHTTCNVHTTCDVRPDMSAAAPPTALGQYLREFESSSDRGDGGNTRTRDIRRAHIRHAAVLAHDACDDIGVSNGGERRIVPAGGRDGPIHRGRRGCAGSGRRPRAGLP